MNIDGYRALQRILGELKGAVVAYSGGSDSAFLADVSSQVLGDRALVITADSPSLPRRELQEAVSLADERGFNHRIVSTLEMSDDKYTSNPTNRCYFCKQALFDAIGPMAQSLGVPMLLGTNLDDLGEHRPGLRSAAEHEARHPLVEAELTKSDVRELSRSLGLATADKPAAACLSSRFRYGVPITPEGLSRVERAEEFLLSLEYVVVRVRDLGGDKARVEVGPEEVQSLLRDSQKVIGGLKAAGFRRVELDPSGYRSGAMNDPTLIPLVGPQGRT